MHYKLRKDLRAFANMVPMVLAIVIAFALLFVGIFVNGEISSNLTAQYNDDPTLRTGTEGQLQNTTVTRLNNISGNQDATLDIVQVVIIITVLAGAIAAIFLFRRFR